jgi:hypothetical protein
MPGTAAGTRSPVCSEESTLVVTAGQPRHRHSLRDGVNAYSRALPGVRDLIVTVACKIIICRLSTSPGVPGPHAFAVRASAARHTARSRPSPPAPNTRDDREAPLFEGTGLRGEDHIFTKNGSKIFVQQIEKSEQIETAIEFRFFAQAIWRLFGHRARQSREEIYLSGKSVAAFSPLPACGERSKPKRSGGFG